ncbi:MAG TPA: M28 family peptidase, partial [Nitrososphaeraceae archaeon]|nr:M28 family peptidase [Nitrososphaeraceae archaeon]
GSKNYAKALHNNNTKIDLLVNLDMIGYPPPSELNKEYVIIEYDEWNKVPTNNIDSKRTAEFMKKITLHYTNLFPRLQNLSNSDFNPFEALGYIVIGLHDGGEKCNPHYHKSSDSPETLDIEYLTAITKLTLATILKLNTNLK